MANEANVSWPGWEVVRIIGRGSFGAVYEIRRDLFGTEESAALKVISVPQNDSDIEVLLANGYTVEDITKRFQDIREDIIHKYALMVGMREHPNVVCCDDFRYVQHEDGTGWDICVKMELLENLFVRGWRLPEAAVVTVGVDICAALTACEESGLVHGHVVPNNILCTQDGLYKLGDVGIFSALNERTDGPVLDTPRSYMAPEIYHRHREPRTAAGDIYSLGLTMYRLLNERRLPCEPLPPVIPPPMSAFRRFEGEPIPAPAHGSEELQQIVLKACSYDIEERYHSARDMLRDLMKYQESY